MAIRPKITIDKQEQESSIEYFFNDVLVSFFKYKAGQVTMSARVADVVTTLATTKPGQKDTVQWVATTQTALTVPRAAVKDYRIRFRTNPQTLDVLFRIRNDTVLDGSYAFASGEIIFKARPVMIVSWTAFRVYTDVVDRFLKLIELSA
jgi:hypothetical protein